MSATPLLTATAAAAAAAANRSSTIPPPSTKNIHPLTPDTLASLIDKSKNISRILQIHASLLRHGLESHPILNLKLQRSYSSLGRLHYSLSLFNNTHNPNLFFYTSIIHSHASYNLHHQALHFYIQMLDDDIEPNAFTFSALLKACPLHIGEAIHSQALKLGFASNTYVRTALVDVYARAGHVGSARQLFDSMPERGLVSVTTMINGYVEMGEIDEARVLFDEMEERDVVCWNVMIDGYGQHRRPKEALVLFRHMLSRNMRPNDVTIVAVLSACGQLGALESGRWVHSSMWTNGIRMNVHVGSALVDMYSKCGSLEDARSVFNSINDKDVVLWNSMIVAYAMHGFSQEALQLFDEMHRRCVHLTDITFIGVLSACAHAGLVSEGWGIFNSMKNKHQIEPKIEHYGCMVNLLGRAGHLEEAYELVKDMKIDPDLVIWGTLLGACRLHGNIKLAEEIAKYLVDHKFANSGTYILLSNIYAATGDWDGVARVRSMMKDCGVHKEPGCSSIEVNNRVHEFLAGDMKHPRSKEIYMMLEEMNGWLKGCGYKPQTDIVLHDIGEIEKERLLEVHSEKLAIAFGLISTKPGSTIKIFKNLRVCSDCHVVMKLLSKTTGRKIVVRDRNRFHHFVDGLCTCGDYW